MEATTFQVNKQYAHAEDGGIEYGRITIVSRSRCFVKYIWENIRYNDHEEYRVKIRNDNVGEYIHHKHTTLGSIFHSVNRDTKLIEETRENNKVKDILSKMGIKVHNDAFMQKRILMKKIKSWDAKFYTINDKKVKQLKRMKKRLKRLERKSLDWDNMTPQEKIAMTKLNHFLYYNTRFLYKQMRTRSGYRYVQDKGYSYNKEKQVEETRKQWIKLKSFKEYMLSNL